MKEVIIINESLIESIGKDLFTFGSLIFCYIFNYQYLGNSTVISITISICFFFFVWGRASSRKSLSIDEAIKKLEAMR